MSKDPIKTNLNIESLPEHNQESAEKSKIKLLDVVALTQDIPEHNLKRGEIGTVVEILSNGEVFEVEFSDENGQMYKCTSFLASQLTVLHDEPINTNPNRQANDAIQGYYYQLCHTVDAWLDLADNDILYVEVAEDYDIESDGTFTATQVKHTQRNISLRSEQVINAINNFWKLRNDNSNRCVKFRLLTKSKIAKEQEDPFGTDKPGLELWSHCSGDEVVIKKISDFLQNYEKISPNVKDFLKQAEPKDIYEQLIEPITWETDSKPASFVKQSICEKLIHHGDRHGISPSKARDIFDPLINEAWKVAGQPENRQLTRLRFLYIFEEKTKRLVSEQHLQHMERLAAMKGAVRTGFIENLSDPAIQSHPHIQTDIPQLYLDIVVPRTKLLTDIQTKLQSDGIVVIQGGVDKGKTTLANLTAKAINDPWFWLKLTNKDASQVPLLLQHLAMAVRNKPSQVNVVLDDLNLQPQQLQMYEDDLGLVVYRVLERGAKLLITSQHEPPDDLIRRLGISSNIVICVPNFTMSEIEQFAVQMGCSTNDLKTWVTFIQEHTGGHPRLVHARFAQLREEGWKQPDTIESMIQTPQEVKKEREAARQLLTDFPEDKREFLYRLSLLTEFRKDYAINIGEIPVPIPHSGDTFSQLVGPWIDQINETYYTISPLLKNAAKEVWSDDKIKDLHAHIVYAILKTKKLNTIEAWAVFTHSMAGQYKEGIIAFIFSLMNTPQNDWENLYQEFSLLVHIKTDPPQELFPGDAFVNQLFRSLQYRIAAEVQPEFAPKILEIWDQETKPYEPRQSYLMARLMLATQALRYNQVPLTAKKLMGYLKYIIETTDNHKDVGEMYFNSYGQFEEYNIDRSNFFSFLFSFIYIRPDINASFLSDLFDTLDELEPRIRTLLLADFESYNINCRVLIESICLHEEKEENPDWTRCLQVYDKVIEKTIEWGYPHIAAASSRGKAIIHDEYLKDHNTAHQVYQDIIFKVGALPVIEEGQAVVYIRHGHYQEALDIYERILPEWYKASERFGVGPLEEYRRAAICAANLDDWKKAACFFEEGTNKTQEIENTERYIGSYADAGFAHFKAGNMLDSIKLLHLALEEFEKLPQDTTNVKYYTLRKRLEHTIKWIKNIWYGSENQSSKLFEPDVGFCSDPETKKEYLDLPYCPIGYSWLHLAQIEYRFGHEMIVFQNALQTTDREEYPILNYWLSFLEAQYEFRNKTFDNLPQRILQLARVFSSMKKHQQKGRGAGEKGSYSISNSDLSDFASVDNIIAIFIAALIVLMRVNRGIQEILTIWCKNSSELLINENINSALELIESILLSDIDNTLTVMYTPDTKVEKLLAASIRIMHNAEASLEDLLFAHTYISSCFINSPWEELVVNDLAVHLSSKWLEKVKFRAKLKTPMLTVPQIEQACKSSETGKKKIGQILLAVHQAVSIKVPLSPEFLHRIRSWIESESKQKQEHAIGKNPTAQRLIKAMEKPPHLTDEDIEALNRSIKEGKIPIKFDSPFDSDESNK